jgi:AbrB family looped-hinge helix DNA binding protein
MFKCNSPNTVIMGQKLETEIVVKKKGQTTIPVRIRRKFKIEEGTRLEVVETNEGILLKPKKSFWDMIGAYSEFGTPEEVKKELDKLRHEDE